MFFLFLYLMGYQPGSGLLLHGILGLSLFTLFILHHLLGLDWYRTLAKGSYPFIRKLFVTVDFMLLAAMLLLMSTGAMLLEMVFPIVFIHPIEIGRSLHVAGSSWCFFLMTVHLGLHSHNCIHRIEQKARDTVLYRLRHAIYAALVACGCFTLWDTELLGKLTLQVEWQDIYDHNVFYAEYLVTVGAMCVLMHLVMEYDGARKRRARNKPASV